MKRKIYTSLLFVAFALWFASAKAQDSVVVTYYVDMSAATLGAAGGTCDTRPFDIVGDVVEAMGAEYNAWTAPENVACGAAFTPNPDIDFKPVSGGSSIYTRTKKVLPDVTGRLTYKYRIDHSWDNDELRGIGDGNRHAVVPAGATAISITSIFNDSANVVSGIHDPLLAQITNVYPNPASDKAVITYNALSSSNDVVNVYISNTIGQVVKTLVNEKQSYGIHQIVFNTTDIETGIYFVNVRVGNSITSQKFSVAR